MSIGYFQWTKIGCFRWTRSGCFRRTLTPSTTIPSYLSMRRRILRLPHFEIWRSQINITKNGSRPVSEAIFVAHQLFCDIFNKSHQDSSNLRADCTSLRVERGIRHTVNQAFAIRPLHCIYCKIADLGRIGVNI